MNLIDKDALVAEIERQQRRLCLLGQSNEVELRKNAAIQNGVFCSLLSFIETLEVKEVDLEKEIELWMKFNVDTNGFFNTLEFAKHCFELGLESAQNCNNSKCEDLRDDGICNFASTRLGRTMHCEKIACSRRNKARKGE
jgi:hypothetical protein